MSTSSGIRNFAIGFAASAVIFIGTLIPFYRSRIREYSGKAEAAAAEKEDLQKRLETAEQEKKRLEQETSRVEKQNDRLRDEVVLADVRLKRLHDRLQSSKTTEDSPSLTTVVSNKPRIDSNKRSNPRKPAAVNVDLGSLIDDMREVTYANYEILKQGQRPKYSKQLKSEFISIAKRHGVQDSTWEELQEFFEKRGQYLSAANVRSKYGVFGDVKLTELVSKKDESIRIDGRDYSFTTFVIRGDIIRDFVMYDSDGKFANISTTIGNRVIHNMDVLSSAAKTAWNVLKYGGKSINAFRRNIIKAEWRELYNECINRHSSTRDAQEEFVERATELYIQDATINEAYHMSVIGTRFSTKDLDENIRSVYFNYMHTPLRQSTFHSEAFGLLRFSEGSQNYETAKIVFTEFIDYIKAEQRRGRFRNIRIRGDSLQEQVQNLYLLTGSQIKKIAKQLYERRIERF